MKLCLVQAGSDFDLCFLFVDFYFVASAFEFFDEVVEDEFLVGGVDFAADDAEQSEDLQVLLFDVVLVFVFGVVFGEVLDDGAVHEVVHEEGVVLQQFLQQVQLAVFVFGDHVVQDELEPLRNVHFEQQVVADQFVDHLVERVVQLQEFVAFVVLV